MTATIMDLREAIDWFQTDETLAVSRRPAGSYVNGLFVAGTPTAITVDAHVQRVAAGDKAWDDLSLPEGMRNSKAVAVYVKAPDTLRIADEPAGVLADQVTFQGETYEVRHIHDFCDIAGYYKAIALKVEAS